MPEIKDADHPHPIERYFDAMRRQRRERLAAKAAEKPRGIRRLIRRRKRRAVVTMVHNEPVFLPIWLGYYSRFFDAGDIHVLDNESSDGSTDRDGFVRVPASHDRVDHTWMAETIQAYQHELLDSYDMVLVTDVDEIVAPRPERGGLGTYLDEFREDFVNTLGYELIHLADREPPIDLRRPILDQRRHWFANDAYDKPALATVPMAWKPGFHERVDAEKNFDPDLLLIHLHRMDFDICRARHRLRRDRKWHDLDLSAGWANHNRITEEAEFEHWFYFESGLESQGIEMEIQRIPPEWRGRF